MHNENRFLDTFRGHNTRPIRTARQININLFRVDKNKIEHVVLPTLFNVVNNVVRHCYTRLRADSGSTTLFNIVDNIECWQKNIV